MGIYLKGKNWYVDYYVKGKRKRKKVGPSKKLAEQVLKDIHVKIAKKEYLGVYDEKRLLFADFAQEYLEYSKTNKSSSMARNEAIHINQQFIPALGQRYLFEITPQMIEKFKATRLEDVTPATVNRGLACIKHMYTKAIEWGYVKTNPAKGVRFLKEPPGRLRYLEPLEVEVLLKACAAHIHPIVVTALNTGMRKGEILNLKWGAIDLNNRRITVTNSKNNEARVIPINGTLYQELSKLPRKSKSEYVFANGKDRPLGDIKKSFATALKRAGIQDFRFHDLRHTFGSQLVMQGVDLRTVQQIMGHKEIKMTMRYSHLSPGHVQEAVGKLDSLWTPYGHQAEKREKAVVVNI